MARAPALRRANSQLGAATGQPQSISRRPTTTAHRATTWCGGILEPRPVDYEARSWPSRSVSGSVKRLIEHSSRLNHARSRVGGGVGLNHCRGRLYQPGIVIGPATIA